MEGLDLNLYPPLLMSMHRLGLRYETAGKLWGVLISALVVLPMFGLFRRQFDDRVATLCCVFYAVHPIFIQWSAEVIRDQTFWFLFMTTLYLQWRAVTEIRHGYFFAAGMAMTLAALTRFEGFFLVIPLVFWSVWRFAALADKPLRRRLILGLTLAFTAFPAILVLANVLWLSAHSQWVFSRLSPLKLVENWWQGMIHPVALPPGAPEELQNISFLRLVEIYVPALVKGLSPLFAVPMLIGMWTRRRTWARSDHQALFWTAVVVMAAAWIHAWSGRVSCDRYYLPIVLMAAPFAVLGTLAVSRRLLLWSERLHAGPRLCRLAVVAPLVIVLLGSATVALASKDNRRQAELDLAAWVRRENGPNALIFGSEGVTPVVAYHAHARFIPLLRVFDDRAVLEVADEKKPDVIMILATRRNDLQETRRLINQIAARGYHEVERHRLPPNTDDVLVVMEREKI
jgi:4-amino-4-deoxy-L-arabinose transferase-like glycosyltransferase